MRHLYFHSTNYVLRSVFRATSSDRDFACMGWFLRLLGWTCLLIIVQKMSQLVLAILQRPWLVNNLFLLLLNILDLCLILVHVGVMLLIYQRSRIRWSHLPIIFGVVEHLGIADVLLFLILLMLMGALAIV